MTNPYAMGPPRGFHPPDPRDLVDPDIQADINRRGIAQVRQVLAQCGARTTGTPETCVHGERNYRTPAGDAFCGECRRDESGTGLREAVAEEMPHEDDPPEEEPW